MKIFKKYKTFFQQDGQTAVFFALLLPVLILFLFVVFDLGWLYLNKSRLQNAAEAAAIAGANKFCTMPENKGYDRVMLIYKTEENLPINTPSSTVNSAAKESWESNLGISADTPTDSWTKAAVYPTYTLYGEEYAEKLYYEVELTEDVQHIFKVLDNVFSTKIPVVAVAEISKGRNLWKDIRALDKTQTILNWEEQNGARKKINSGELTKPTYNSGELTTPTYLSNVDPGMFDGGSGNSEPRYFYDGNWNHFQDMDKKVHYDTGELYKYENIEVGNNPFTNKASTFKKTEANGNHKEYTEDEVDALNIDFKQDVNLSFNGTLTKDWDIGFDITDTTIKKVNLPNKDYIDNWNESQINLRIHATINFNQNYKTRTLSEEDKAKVDARYKISGVAESADADPLYVRIESEPMVSDLYGRDTMPQLNSVRQIILNINESNIDDDDNEHTHEYKYRPLVIFYDGPEKNDPNSARESQPVIVNLNADFRGILFMPNSPVVINGKGYNLNGTETAHKFQGFVIAKEFRRLKTENEYTKFTREIDNEVIYIEDLERDTEPGSSDNWVMVRKPNTNDWVMVDKSQLRYLSEYTKIASYNTTGDPNHNTTETEYTFNYSKTYYIIKKSELETSIFTDATNYDTTTYYRHNLEKSEKPTPAYVQKNLKEGNFVGATLKLDDKGKWVVFDNKQGKWVVPTETNPPDTQIISGRAENWYEIKIREDNVWSVKNANYYFLYKDNYRIVSDENNLPQQYIVHKNYINQFTKFDGYIEVTDVDGKPAYILKTDWNNAATTIYLKLIGSGDSERYVDKNSYNYFFKKSDSEPLMIDRVGNVQTEIITSDYTYPEADNNIKLDEMGKRPGFKPETFELDTDVDDTHYSRCGAVPHRLHYTALDDFERNKSYCKDMFFETERARYVL